MQNLVESSNAGTKKNEKGQPFFSDIKATIPAEMKLPKCSVALMEIQLCRNFKKYELCCKNLNRTETLQ